VALNVEDIEQTPEGLLITIRRGKARAPAGIPKCGLFSRGGRGADGSRMGAPIGLVELRRCVA
jgi:hypothetical protein